MTSRAELASSFAFVPSCVTALATTVGRSRRSCQRGWKRCYALPMLPRALVPVVFCVAVTWSLSAIACGNSMDSAPAVSGHLFWLDMLVWPVGAVFLNRVVLVNLRGPATEDPSNPSGGRRPFFLLVGVCLVLVLVSVWAGGPLLALNAQSLSGCDMSLPMLPVLLVGPAFFFVSQSVLFHRFGGGRFALVSLVLSSLILALMVDVARTNIVLPMLCGPEWSPSFADPY